MDKSTIIRDAATVIVIRDRASAPKILVGQRGAHAAFMPNKFVFPGGAVDPEDHHVPLIDADSASCKTRLAQSNNPTIARGLMAAAIRELWEETGQILGAPGAWSGDIPNNWTNFAQQGLIPSAQGLTYVFRAITPKSRPRRFDARFFLIDANQLQGDPDDFSEASEELSHLQWVPLEQLRHYDLPFITQVVLAQITANLADSGPPKTVPIFNNLRENCKFEYIS